MCTPRAKADPQVSARRALTRASQDGDVREQPEGKRAEEKAKPIGLPTRRAAPQGVGRFLVAPFLLGRQNPLSCRTLASSMMLARHNSRFVTFKYFREYDKMSDMSNQTVMHPCSREFRRRHERGNCPPRIDAFDVMLCMKKEKSDYKTLNKKTMRQVKRTGSLRARHLAEQKAKMILSTYGDYEKKSMTQSDLKDHRPLSDAEEGFRPLNNQRNEKTSLNGLRAMPLCRAHSEI
jgi:hypothetical protein